MSDDESTPKLNVVDVLFGKNRDIFCLEFRLFKFGWLHSLLLRGFRLFNQLQERTKFTSIDSEERFQIQNKTSKTFKFIRQKGGYDLKRSCNFTNNSENSLALM
jgi:hypothetical protein